MEKFSDPKITAKGETRAWVNLKELKTIWINSGTLCNLSCENCYIESSPTNDSLVYITSSEITPYLNEIKSEKYPVELIGITGGEPFINPDIINIIENILARGHQLLILTNAYRILKRHHERLIALNEKFPKQLFLRVSLDHHTKEIHEKERGEKTFEKTLEEMKWLVDNDFQVSIAGRSLVNEELDQSIKSYQALLDNYNIDLELRFNDNIVIFPEMIQDESVPEITTECWGILDKSPEDQMCASERMIVKKKGHEKPVVLPCTLLAYDEQFELGHTLKESEKPVYLNHVYCAKFCVLGGASCSSAK